MPARTVAATGRAAGGPGQVAPVGQRRRGIRDREVQLDTQRTGAGVVQPELELGHHAEVPATATQPPEQFGILFRRGMDDVATRGHHLARGRVVARQAVLAGEPTHAAAQGETTNAVCDVAGRRGQAMRLGGRIESPQQGAALNPRSSAIRVDADRTHRGQIDHQPALWHRQPDDAVSTAADTGPPVPRGGPPQPRPRRLEAPCSERSAPDGGPPSHSRPDATRRNPRRLQPGTRSPSCLSSLMVTGVGLTGGAAETQRMRPDSMPR